MKPAYIPDTVIYGVTDKIPNIKFKKSMKKKKVYVLVCDSTSRGEQEITLNTFDSKEKAVQKMNIQFDITQVFIICQNGTNCSFAIPSPTSSRPTSKDSMPLGLR